MKRVVFVLTAVITMFTAGVLTPAQGAGLQIMIENLQPAGGYYFTPVWLGFHDGGFDLFDMGAAASSELEMIAEEGNPAPLGALFNSVMNGDGSSRQGAVVTAPAGFPGAPVFDPGDSVTQMIDVMDPASNRYLSFASMVIPSNDTFFGNMDPMGYEVFNADGSFAGPITIDIMGNGLYDAGTEVSNAMGAAFSALGGTSSDEGGVVNMSVNLDNFLNSDTAAGTSITSALGSSPLARIHISAVPEPTSIGLLLCALPALLRLRRS
ncbi:MAG: spondin domain-containing protein [Planctomycetales bacterium]|nr:spondin domain-containing protein [Planctomycetales bacterium]